MNSNFRNLAIWVVIGLLLMALFNLFQNPGQGRRGNEISYSEFLAGVEAGNVSEVTIAKHRISGVLSRQERQLHHHRARGPQPGRAAQQEGREDHGPAAGGGRALHPGRAGQLVPDAAADRRVDLLHAPDAVGRRARHGLRQVQGQAADRAARAASPSRTWPASTRPSRTCRRSSSSCAIRRSSSGSAAASRAAPCWSARPGTGKTLLARAIAGEANVPFFTISGSDFVEMFVGVGASRVRDMFEQAKKNAPCIIFIDEIDAVGRHRGAGLGGGNDEREQTLNQLLVEMDGFEANEGIILIAATNRPDVLDPALLRPGRFDRQIMVPNPDVGGREKILRVHMRKVPLAPDVDPKVIARGTPGFSGADLANLVNEAALLAARRNKRLVTQAEFEDAKDKVMMGAERRSMIMTEEEKLATAYHEAGHALVNLLVAGNDPLHKVTIIPRGRALGVTMSLPERDKLCYSKQWCEARIAMMFGGRVAEQLDLRRGPPQHRRLQRHHAGDRARPAHGHRVGHER